MKEGKNFPLDGYPSLLFSVQKHSLKSIFTKTKIIDFLVFSYAQYGCRQHVVYIDPEAENRHPDVVYNDSPEENGHPPKGVRSWGEEKMIIR